MSLYYCRNCTSFCCGHKPTTGFTRVINDGTSHKNMTGAAAEKQREQGKYNAYLTLFYEQKALDDREY